jgi:hypothetical protein
MIYVWFTLLYPQKKNRRRQNTALIFFISGVVWLIYFFSVYTGLEDFLKGTAHSQIIRLYLSFSVQFILCRLYINWLEKRTNILTGV